LKQQDTACPLCKKEEETMDHMFFHCDFTTKVALYNERYDLCIV